MGAATPAILLQPKTCTGVAKFLFVKLERRNESNDTFCPQVVHGLKGGSADLLLDVAQYRKLRIWLSTIEEESAAWIIQAGLSSKLLH
jgi:hypothetical protein